MATSLGVLNPFRYRGYVYDEETSLYYLRSRYYNPEWGRFINADSVLGETGQLLGHNVFAYCGNSPIKRSDPFGHAWFLAILAAITAASLLTGCSPQDIDFSSYSDLDRETANWGSYNCYGNAIGKCAIINPTGYITGEETSTTFNRVVSDIGADNIRLLESINNDIGADENLVAMKCGDYDYHFMVCVDGIWYNKPGTTPLIIDESVDIVTLGTWYGRWINTRTGEFVCDPNFKYQFDTIYFAIKKEWDEE